MLSNQELKNFKHNLEEKIEKITNILKVTSTEMRDSFSTHENDEDSVAILSNQHTNLSVLKIQTKDLEEMKLALKKIHQGTYGICEMCDEDIFIERLKVKPFARYCISCREIIEAQR